MSNIFSLNIRDVAKGVITAVLAGVLTFIYAALQSGTAIDWQQVLTIAVTAGLSYIIKNFLSDSNGKVLGRI